MKAKLLSAAALSGGLLISAQTVVGAETEIKGRACWTGTIDALATSPKDSGYTWKNTGTYVDGNDKADNLYYRCVGIGGVIAGKPQKISWWCLGHTSDDSTVLWRGESNKDSSSTEQYISGTGRYEGVTGTLNGSVLMPAFKAPQGKFAACRDVSGVRILK